MGGEGRESKGRYGCSAHCSHPRDCLLAHVLQQPLAHAEATIGGTDEVVLQIEVGSCEEGGVGGIHDGRPATVRLG